jgi:hypothetical protein
MSWAIQLFCKDGSIIESPVICSDSERRNDNDPRILMKLKRFGTEVLSWDDEVFEWQIISKERHE